MAERKSVGQVSRLDVSIERGATFEQNFIYRRKPSVIRPIQRIDRANPGKVLCENHKFDSGDTVFLSGFMGMNEAINRAFTVTVIDTNYFTLGVNTTSYGAYVSGGTADDGVPYDLSDYNASVEIMSTYGETPFLTLTPGNDGIVLGGGGGHDPVAYHR